MAAGPARGMHNPNSKFMTDRPAPPIHAPMTHYAVVDQQLQVGGLPLTRLAARVGRTPFYVYDRSLISSRVAELRQALPAAIRLHYAIKANPMAAVVGHLAGLVDGLDTASAAEITLALNAGMTPQHISLAGPGKQDHELEQAVAAGILINVESLREAEKLAEISARTGWAARVALRLNPAFELKGAGMRMGGGPRQFGVDAEQAPALLTRIGHLGLAFEGFHIFAGSQNLNAGAIAETQRLSFELARQLADNAPSAVKHLNLGGGFGIPYFPGEQRLDLAPIGEALATIAADAARDLPGAELVLELGRYLVGEAGLYVTRVVDVKVSRGLTYLITDGGMNHHLAASGNLGQVIRKNYPVAIGNRMGANDQVSTSVVGPLCTPLDILADKMTLPAAVPGDLVVVFQSGAYGASASPQGFLSHPAVAEVLV